MNKKTQVLNDWANEAGKRGTEASYQQDLEYILNTISGGLNKRKSTGQTTVPVIASQVNRTETDSEVIAEQTLRHIQYMAGITEK